MMNRITLTAMTLAISMMAINAQASLIGYWNLNETAGPTAADSSPSGADGTIGAGVTLNQPSTHPGFGTAARFDGTTGQSMGVINVGNAPFGSLQNNITIAAWINPDQTGGVRRVWGIDGPGAPQNAGYGFGLQGSGLRFTTFGVKDYNIGVAGGIQTGTWTHVAAVMDGNNDVTFYVNGASIGTITHSAPGNTTNADDFTIGGGSFFAQERFVGLIDEVRVYDMALTGDQIAALTRPVPEPATAALSMISVGAVLTMRRRRA